MSAATIESEPTADQTWRLQPSRASVVTAVAKRLMPMLAEATLIPTLLFYAFLVTVDLRWAFVAGLAWCYSAVVRRLAGSRPVPGLLVLGCLGMTVRTVIYLLSGNAFVYFVQPILRTLVTATTFAFSVLIGRSHQPDPVAHGPDGGVRRHGDRRRLGADMHGRGVDRCRFGAHRPLRGPGHRSGAQRCDARLRHPGGLTGHDA